MECDEITPLNRRIYCDDPKDGYNCVSCHNRLVLEEDKVNEVPTLEDVKYAKLRLRMQGLAQLLKLNSQFLLKHSRITKNEVIHGVDVSYAAAQIRIYEIIEHDLDEIEAYKGDAREPCAFYQSPKSPEGVEG
jgi:hypothetical protein